MTIVMSGLGKYKYHQFNQWTVQRKESTWARPSRPVNALIREDLPTLDRPMNAISGRSGGGHSVYDVLLLINSALFARDNPPVQTCIMAQPDARPSKRERERGEKKKKKKKKKKKGHLIKPAAFALPGLLAWGLAFSFFALSLRGLSHGRTSAVSLLPAH